MASSPNVVYAIGAFNRSYTLDITNNGASSAIFNGAVPRRRVSGGDF